MVHAKGTNRKLVAGFFSGEGDPHSRLAHRKTGVFVVDRAMITTLGNCRGTGILEPAQALCARWDSRRKHRGVQT